MHCIAHFFLDGWCSALQRSSADFVFQVISKKIKIDNHLLPQMANSHLTDRIDRTMLTFPPGVECHQSESLHLCRQNSLLCQSELASAVPNEISRRLMCHAEVVRCTGCGGEVPQCSRESLDLAKPSPFLHFTCLFWQVSPPASSLYLTNRSFNATVCILRFLWLCVILVACLWHTFVLFWSQPYGRSI